MWKGWEKSCQLEFSGTVLVCRVLGKFPNSVGTSSKTSGITSSVYFLVPFLLRFWDSPSFFQFYNHLSCSGKGSVASAPGSFSHLQIYGNRPPRYDTWTKLSHVSNILDCCEIFQGNFQHMCLRKKDVGKKSLYRRLSPSYVVHVGTHIPCVIDCFLCAVVY